MPKTYTEQALFIVERQLQVAAQDRTPACCRGISFTAKGYILLADGRRIGKAAAVQILAAALEAEDNSQSAPEPKAKGQPKRTGFTWDVLNQATKDFFFALGERIQAVTSDHDMLNPAPVQDLSIGLANAPRFTNLKKAGLVRTFEGARKSHKWVELTDAGRAIWLVHNG